MGEPAAKKSNQLINQYVSRPSLILPQRLQRRFCWGVGCDKHTLEDQLHPHFAAKQLQMSLMHRARWSSKSCVGQCSTRQRQQLHSVTKFASRKVAFSGSAINTEIWCLYCFINSTVIELVFEDFYFVTLSSSLHLLLRPRACKFLNLCLPQAACWLLHKPLARRATHIICMSKLEEQLCPKKSSVEAQAQLATCIA